MLESDPSEPIYVLVAEWLENEILEGALSVDEKVYSQYQLAEMFNINPATAGKGITLLLNKDLVYQKRGLGTFVSKDGREKLLAERTEYILEKKIKDLLEEAQRVDIDYQQLIQLIEKAHRQQGGEKESPSSNVRTSQKLMVHKLFWRI